MAAQDTVVRDDGIRGEGLRVAVREGVATLRIDRPETLNSLTFGIYEELRRRFLELQDEAAVRAVVLVGEGRAFCSGGSVTEIIGPLLQRDAAGMLAFTRMTCDVVRRMRALRKPIVAAVNGIAVGAGAVLATAADCRIFARDARIGFLFNRVGLSGGDMGVAYLLPRIVGLGRASELLFTGEIIESEEAYRIGLANRVVPNDRCTGTAWTLAKRIADGPALGNSITKELLTEEMGMDLEAALGEEARAQALCMESEDFREGHRAFLEKRAPDFHGRARR